MSTARNTSPYVEKAAVEEAFRRTEAMRQQAKEEAERANRAYLEARERLRKLTR